MSGHNYYARQSEREYYARRVSKTFRLHPDRVTDLDAIARDRNITQARAVEEVIREAADNLQRATEAAEGITAEELIEKHTNRKKR